MSHDWRQLLFYQWYKLWQRQMDFRRVSFSAESKTIKADPVKSNAGVVGNVEKSYADGDPGIYTLRSVYDSKFQPGTTVSAGLYPFTTHTFLPIVSRGSRTGPTASEIAAAYTNTTFGPTYIVRGPYDGYQQWTVPATGLYQFELNGAAGGTGDTGYSGQYSLTTYGACRGAKIIFTATLTSGDLIDICVGVQGGSSGGPHGNENGGGGGSWAFNRTTNTLLGVAGGGGGLPSSSYSGNCNTNSTAWGYGCGSANEVPAYQACYTSPSTPTAGYGGTAGGSYHGGAGGGYLSNGENGGTHCSMAVGGTSFLSGLYGGVGNSCYHPDNAGGFGGGGGGQLGSPGAAGGYTGGRSSGAWSTYATYGGGGGSYVNPSSGFTVISKTTGGNTDTAGWVKVTKL